MRKTSAFKTFKIIDQAPNISNTNTCALHKSKNVNTAGKKYPVCHVHWRADIPKVTLTMCCTEYSYIWYTEGHAYNVLHGIQLYLIYRRSLLQRTARFPCIHWNFSNLTCNVIKKSGTITDAESQSFQKMLNSEWYIFNFEADLC